jgi:hypothetical protein
MVRDELLARDGEEENASRAKDAGGFDQDSGRLWDVLQRRVAEDGCEGGIAEGQSARVRAKVGGVGRAGGRLTEGGGFGVNASDGGRAVEGGEQAAVAAAEIERGSGQVVGVEHEALDGADEDAMDGSVGEKTVDERREVRSRRAALGVRQVCGQRRSGFRRSGRG